MNKEKAHFIQLVGNIRANGLSQNNLQSREYSGSKSKSSSFDKSNVDHQKERIQSNQRISQKLSPVKRQQTVYYDSIDGQSRLSYNKDNKQQTSETYFANQSNSTINVHYNDKNQTKITSNPSTQMIRVNFVNSPAKGPQKSLNNITKPNIYASDMIANTKPPLLESRQIQLQRKLKILSNRVGQIHKQKHEMMGKLNQQNRKIYHQNTALKLRINNLCKQLQKKKQDDKEHIKILKNNYFEFDKNVDDSRTQLECIRRQIQYYKNLLNKQRQKNIQMKEKCQYFQGYIEQRQQENITLNLQIKQLKQIILLKDDTIINHQRQNQKIIRQNSQYRSKKIDLERDMQSIKLQTVQNNQRNNQIIQQYKLKFNQYQVAYSQSQETIQELTRTLAYYQTQTDQKIQEQQQEEEGKDGKQEETVNEGQNECQLLQKHLHQALQDRDKLIDQLQGRIQELQSRYQQKCLQYQQITVQNQLKQEKLQKVSLMLEKYNDKFKQMESKYEQLSTKYEKEKQTSVKVDNNQNNQKQKCKKCSQLLKTIFRLNTHLNAKRLQ